MKKLKLFSLLMLLFVGVTSMWADQVTSVANIVSGQKYYIGSTKSNSTDYYLQVTGRGATTGKVKGTAVTSKDDADLFTFTQVTGGWTIQFENGKYLVLPNAKDNGKVYVQADAGSWTLADASSLISFKYGDFYLKNNQATNTTNFGMYASGQLDLWLEPAATASTPKVSYEQPTGGTLLLKHGETNLASGDEVEAGEEVTVIATPGEGYKLPATISFKDGENQVVDPDDLTFIENDDKNGGAFLMPNYDLTVAASFTAKAVSAVTVNNPEHGEITVTGAENLAAVTEGTELTVNIAGSGYTFSLKYKEGEGEWKSLENGGVITMPAQALTITADEAVITSPYITPSVAKVDFGAVVKDASVDAVEFNIEGNYLAEGNLSVSLLDGTAFEVAPASVPVNGALSATKITVTAKSTATAGTFEDILVISGGGLANDVELDVVLTVQELHTATWFVNGENIKSQQLVEGAALEIPANPTKLSDDCAEMVFKGWVTAPIASPLDEAPEFVTTEGLKMGDANANYYAVFATEKKEEIDGDIEWVATAFADLATNDVVVYASESYAMSNNNGSSSAPSAVAITAAAGKLTAEPAATIQWTIEKDGTSIQFKNSTNYLYCIGQNNGIRVGSGDAKVFSIKDAYLYNDGQGRYCGVYNNADWRCYTTINTNITGQTFTFYKKTVSKQEVTSYTGFLTTCPECSKVTLLKADAEHGSFILKQNGVEVTAPVKTCDAAEITIEATPNPGCQFKFASISTLSGASISGTTITLTAGTAGELTVSASFAQNDYKVVLEQTGEAEAELTGATEAAHYGDKIDVSAPAVGGFHFIGWDASGVSLTDPTANAQSFSMPANNVTLTAKYAKIMSVEEALALIPNPNDTYNNAVVEAFISSVKDYSDTYKSIEYYLEDLDENGYSTGYSTENYILVYGGKGINGADFSSINDIKAHAKVKIFGQLKNYGGTKEFTANNYQLSYEEAEYVGLRIYGEATKTKYEAGDAFSTDGLSAKYLYSNGYAQETTPMWNIEPYYIAANTTTVTVKAYNSKEEYSPAVEVPVTVKTHVVNYEDAELGTITMKVLNAEEDFESGASFVKGTVLVATVTATDEDYRYTNLEITGTPEKVENLYVTVGEEDLTITPAFAKKPAPGLTWNPVTTEATAYTVGKEASLPELVNPNSVSITYTSSDPLVATINAEGVITPLKAGETVIKAKSAANDTYCKDSVSYTLTVLAPASVAVTGDASKKEYNPGETFSFAGLGAKAIYAENDEYTIPAAEITWAPDPAPVINASGNVEVTATWNGITSPVKNIAVTALTYTFTVFYAEHGTLTFKVGDDEVTPGQGLAAGTVVDVIATPEEDYKLSYLTANGNDIKSTKQFTIVASDDPIVINVSFITKAAPEIRWGNYASDRTFYTVGKEAPEAIPAFNNPHELPVIFATDKEEVATVNEAGEIEVKYVAGTAHITATFAGNDDYLADQRTMTIYVYAPNSVVVTGEASKTVYEAGETFSFAGLGAKAIYTDKAEYEIPAEEITWAPAPAPAINANGNVAVTATWEGLTSSEVNVGVTVKTHKVIFADYDSENNVYLNVWNGEEQITSGDAFAKGTVLTVEAILVYTVDDVLTSLTANGTSIIESKKFTIDEADVTILATTEQKPIAPISWSNEGADVNVTMGSSYELPTLVNTEGLNILYHSSNEDVAAINPAGEITLKAAGVTSIEAQNLATEEGTYRTTFVQYNLFVAEAPVKFYIAGSMTDWENNMIAVRADSYMLHLEAGAYQMKVVDGDDWKGFADMTAHADNMFVGNDGNIGFVLAQEGDVVVNYVHDGAFTVQGTFVLPVIQIIGNFNGPWDDNTEPITLDVVADGKASKTLNLTGNWYDFKVIRAGEWLGKDNAGDDNYLINRDNNSVGELDYNEGVKAISIQPDKAGDYTFSYTFETGVLSVDFPDHIYTVAGTESVFGTNWNPADENNDMVKQLDGSYLWEKTELEIKASTIEFKVCQDHGWAQAWPGANYKLVIPEDGIYTISITFNPESKNVVAEATKTGEAEIDPTAELGFGVWDGEASDWNEVDMELAEDKKSASLKVVLAAGSYRFKTIINAGYRSNAYTYHRDFTGADGITLNEDANMKLIADIDGEYTFTWTFETNALEITFPALPAEKYYVAGSWDNWFGWVEMSNDEGTWTAAVELTGSEYYQFQIIRVQGPYETWYGLASTTTMKYGNSHDWVIGGGSENIGLETTNTAEYTFTFVPGEMPKLSVEIPNPGEETGINNTDASVKAVKTMENGVLIIRRGDKTYNGQGQLVK